MAIVHTSNSRVLMRAEGSEWSELKTSDWAEIAARLKVKNNSFHSCSDGRGRRYVFVNGIQVHNVFWANIEKGLVCYGPVPIKVNKRTKEVYTRLLRGEVEVVFANE